MENAHQTDIAREHCTGDWLFYLQADEVIHEKYLQIIKDHGSFNDFVWSFVDAKPITNSWKTISEIPATTKESDAMSKALKKKGFTFVGPTICYAFMQAVGMVNDHITTCYRYEEIKNLSDSY